MANDKYTWQEGDIELIDEAALDKHGIIYNTDSFRPYRECADSSSCPMCDGDDQTVGAAIAERIYESYFKDGAYSEELLSRVLLYYVDLCRELLADDFPLTKQILCCARVGLHNILASDPRFPNEELTRIFKNN